MVLQTNTGSSSESTAENRAKAVFDRYKQFGAREWRWWWHSHHSMPAFWSGTDQETLEALTAPNGWLAATVFNKKNESRSAVCFSSPIPCWIDDIPFQVGLLPTADEKATWKAEFDRCVIRPPTQVYWDGMDSWSSAEDWERHFTQKTAAISRRMAGFASENTKVQSLDQQEVEVRRNGLGFRDLLHRKGKGKR